MTIADALAGSTAAIKGLKHYPGNPRRGNVAIIAESLKAHGQYRPVLVQKGTRYILAGNHTVDAAKMLGWDKVAVQYIDCDDAEARRIVLADNRAADLGGYDQPALKGLLDTLPDLDGTGFTADDLARLAPRRPSLPRGPETPDERAARTVDTGALIDVCGVRIVVDSAAFKTWLGDRDKEDLQALLRLPQAVVIRAARRSRAMPTDAAQRIISSGTAPVDDLATYPGNPRVGDVQAIAESLAAHGQVRPIVAQVSTKYVLVGNHTYLAARALGWSEVAVVWIDVDDDEAARIVLMDNRTSDKGANDPEALLALLQDTPDLAGTGYGRSDVEDLLASVVGGPRRPATVLVRIGSMTWRVAEDVAARWRRAHNAHDLAAALDLPAGSWALDL